MGFTIREAIYGYTKKIKCHTLIIIITYVIKEDIINIIYHQ